MLSEGLRFSMMFIEASRKMSDSLTNIAELAPRTCHFIYYSTFEHSRTTFEKANICNIAVYQDTNEQQNKGCAILVKNGLSFTQLVEITEQSKSIDTVWGVLEWDGNRLLFGTTYLKLGYEKGVMEFLKMLKCAEKRAKIHGCKGIITIGDFNARHTSWDEKTNTYAKF